MHRKDSTVAPLAQKVTVRLDNLDVRYSFKLGYFRTICVQFTKSAGTRKDWCTKKLATQVKSQCCFSSKQDLGLRSLLVNKT